MTEVDLPTMTEVDLDQKKSDRASQLFSEEEEPHEQSPPSSSSPGRDIAMAVLAAAVLVLIPVLCSLDDAVRRTSRLDFTDPKIHYHGFQAQRLESLSHVRCRRFEMGSEAALFAWCVNLHQG